MKINIIEVLIFLLNTYKSVCDTYRKKTILSVSVCLFPGTAKSICIGLLLANSWWCKK